MSEPELPPDASAAVSVPLDEVPALPSVEPPPTPIDQETPCRRCGYLLRGLIESANCPECGTPVALSIQSDQLRFADPAWLRLIHIGMRLIFWHVIIGFAAVAFVFVVRLNTFTGSQIVAHLISLTVQIISVTGVWLISTPNPADVRPVTPTARLLARTSALIAFALSVLDLFLFAFDNLATPRNAMIAIELASTLMRIITVVTQLLIMACLAARIPATSMSKQARSVARGMAYCYPLLLIFSVIPTFFVTARSTLFAALGCVGVIVLIPFCIFSIMNFVLIIRLGNAIKRQRQLAETPPTLPATV